MLRSQHQKRRPKDTDTDTRSQGRGGHRSPHFLPSPHGARVSPAPGHDGLRRLRLHADTSRPKVTGRAEAATAAAIFPAVSAGSGSGSGASLVRRRTGPAGNTSMRGRRTPAARGPALGCNDVLGGRGELRDQAVGSAGAREGRGGRGAQVRTPPVLSGSVWPLPQPCSAQTRAEPPGARPDQLREEFTLLTPRVLTAALEGLGCHRRGTWPPPVPSQGGPSGLWTLRKPILFSI